MSNLAPGRMRSSLKKPDPMPIIRRSRSWRGIMQVRYDENKGDRKNIWWHFLLWSPLRIVTVFGFSTSLLYVYLGHDQFMHVMMGYESEMQYESTVNPTGTNAMGTYKEFENDRGWKKGMRNLEKPLHPRREFDVMKSSTD